LQEGVSERVQDEHRETVADDPGNCGGSWRAQHRGLWPIARGGNDIVTLDGSEHEMRCDWRSVVQKAALVLTGGKDRSGFTARSNRTALVLEADTSQICIEW